MPERIPYLTAQFFFVTIPGECIKGSGAGLGQILVISHAILAIAGERPVQHSSFAAILFANKYWILKDESMAMRNRFIGGTYHS